MSLPWTPTRLRASTAVRLECGERDRGSVCAKVAAVGTSPGFGTSATVRSRNAAAWSAAGRRHGGRPGDGRIPKSRPGTLRQKGRAASGPRLRPRPIRVHRLRHRVVTQLTIFSPPLCDRPGCHESPASSPRNPARYCGPDCRKAVRNVCDRERKWLSRGTLDGRKKRAFEYQADRRRRLTRHSTAAADSSPRAPPD
jgi:hypothetical protein